ncbi:hypothetical protein [Streptomyces sp. NPDC003943]
MGESVQVRCPECLRTLHYAAPAFPCACGTPVAPPVIPGAAAEPITHRNWSDEWVTVRCTACARTSDWPHPEVGCPCGAVLRVAVRDAAGRGMAGRDGAARGAAEGVRDGARAVREPGGGPGAGPDRGADGGAGIGLGGGADGTEAVAEPLTGPVAGPAADPADAPAQNSPGSPSSPSSGSPSSFARRHPSPLPPLPPHPGRTEAGAGGSPRTAFRPVTIRTTRDAVAASAGYLRWLGFRDVVQPEERSASAVDLRGPGLVAQVDPSTRPTGLRAVECLWLNGLSNAAVSVYFSLAGYTPEAHDRAEGLGVPLFVLDLTGTPQPVNRPAGELLAAGAP